MPHFISHFAMRRVQRTLSNDCWTIDTSTKNSAFVSAEWDTISNVPQHFLTYTSPKAKVKRI